MKKRRNYFVCILLILAAAFFLSWQNGLFGSVSVSDGFRILSDSFFAPGFVFFGIGAIDWSSTKGTYDMLSFGCGRAVRHIVPGMNKEKYNEFYKYKNAKDESGRTWHPHLLWCGLGALLVSGIFIIFYFCFG